MAHVMFTIPRATMRNLLNKYPEVDAWWVSHRMLNRVDVERGNLFANGIIQKVYMRDQYALVVKRNENGTHELWVFPFTPIAMIAWHTTVGDAMCSAGIPVDHEHYSNIDWALDTPTPTPTPTAPATDDSDSDSDDGINADAPPPYSP
jgi:hypothetical protein